MSRTREARPGEQVKLVGRAAVQLGQHRAGDIEPLGHGGAHLGIQLHRLPGQPLQPAPDPAGRIQEDRNQHQRDERDQPGVEEHRGEHQHQLQHARDHRRQGRGQCLLGPDHVAVQAADQRAGLRPGEERDRLPLHVLEHLGPQVIDETLADPRGEVALHDAEEGVEDRQPGDDRRDGQHDAAVLGQDALVDDDAQQHRVQHRDHGVQCSRDQEDRQVQPVRPGVADNPAHGAWLQPLLGHRRITGEPAHGVPLVLHAHDG